MVTVQLGGFNNLVLVPPPKPQNRHQKRRQEKIGRVKWERHSSEPPSP